MDVDESSDEPIIPQHTKQAAKAIALLLFYSFLMFTLPFGAFFGTRHILREIFDISGFSNTAYSVFAAIVVVYMIIFAYAYQAYHEREYDEHGNEISTNKSKSSLNLKED